MLFDCVFFVKGLPGNRRLHDKGLFMAEFPSDAYSRLFEALSKAAAADASLLAEFFRTSEEKNVVAVGMRIEAKEPKGAMALGRHRLDAFIDNWSLTMPQIPKVSQLVVVCPEGAQDGQLQSFSPSFWIELTRPTDSKGSDLWSERNDEMFDALIPLFDIATNEHVAATSSLARQLAFSLKMFRHGSESAIFAIEFLCKFAALEGLVCGDERNYKRQKLAQRLPDLFKTDADVSDDLISELWNWRSEVVHQSRGFYSEFANEGKPVQVHVATLDRLFGGTVAFAVAHLGVAESVDDLWTKVAGYSLPTFASMKRPAGVMRVAGVNWHGGTGLVLTGAREMFEQCLHSANNHIPSSQPTKAE